VHIPTRSNSGTLERKNNSVDEGVADFLGDAVSVDKDSLPQIDYPATGIHGYVATAYNYVSHVPYVASM
jgi:hypothetical protein